MLTVLPARSNILSADRIGDREEVLGTLEPRAKPVFQLSMWIHVAAPAAVWPLVSPTGAQVAVQYTVPWCFSGSTKVSASLSG